MNNKFSNVKKTVTAAMCTAMCVVLPLMLHALPNAGSTLCPMHIPVLLCGFICGWSYGMLCGLAGPMLSSLVTGMPSMATLPVMSSELMAYGAVTGIMMQLVRTKIIYIDLYISLLSAMIAGRVLAGVMSALIFLGSGVNYSMSLWAASYFITSLPGIIIHLTILPGIIFALEKSRLIPVRYPEKRG